MKPAKPCETKCCQVSRFSLESPDETNETTPLKGWFRWFRVSGNPTIPNRLFLLSIDLGSGWHAPWIARSRAANALAPSMAIQQHRRLTRASRSGASVLLSKSFR